MKIKVCGMRHSDNIKELVKLSPDYIGFIFYKKSKRFVADFPEVEIPKGIKKVGVFVNETIDEIRNKVNKYNLQAVQLHGDETPIFCKELKCQFERSRELMIIKAFAVNAAFDFNETKPYQDSCDVFLFDTKGNDYGGNGIKYDWNILKKYKGKTPYLLSGGISENDVEPILSFMKGQAFNQCLGVDVNSGFEDSPANKNIEKLKIFLKKVKE